MAWFAAHAVMYFRFKDGKQDHYPVWENVYLVEAQDARQAGQKGCDRAQLDEGDSDGTLYCDGRMASLVFAGFRKLISFPTNTKRAGSGMGMRSRSQNSGLRITHRSKPSLAAGNHQTSVSIDAPNEMPEARMVLRAASLIAAMLLVGCAASPAVGYNKGNGATLCESAATGRCDLYDDRSRLVGSRTIICGEPLGFRKDGREVVAVAGPYVIPLQDGNYRWIVIEAHSPLAAPPPYRGTWHETGGIRWRPH